MKSGELRHRIVLESPVQTADGMSGFTTTWTEAGRAWAGVWPVSASEQVKAAQTSMEITHRIRIRYRADIDSSWRIKFGTRYFDIVSIVNPEERNRLLDLVCKEAS